MVPPVSRRCELVPEWALDPRDEAAIAALLAECFPTDFGGRSFYRQRPHVRLLWRDAEIAGHLALHYRSMRLGDALIRVLGLGDLAVRGDARGQGGGTRLVARALDEARRARCDAALLFGRRGLYDRAGFRQVRNPLLNCDLTGARSHALRHEHSDFLRIAPLTGIDWPEHETLDLLGPMM